MVEIKRNTSTGEVEFWSDGNKIGVLIVPIIESGEPKHEES